MSNLLILVLCLQVFAVHVWANRPAVFIKNIDLAVIQENTPIGTVVFQLEGADPENSTVTYGLEDTDHFSVDKKTGAITVAKPIDREENGDLKFFVTLEDFVGNGQDNNLVRVPVTIIVIDENDNPPKFQNEPFESKIREDAQPGETVFGPLKVSDADDVGGVLQIRCEFSPESPDACDHFSVSMLSLGHQTSSASIVLRKPLVLRSPWSTEKSTYKLRLVADDGRHETSTTVTIAVEDVQNRPPVFMGSLTGIVDEDAPVGSLVMKVVAKDGDEGNSRNITYELISNPETFFSIHQDTGEIRTIKPLDREVFVTSNGVVTVGVKASEIERDGSRPLESPQEEWTSSAALSITIRDVNDEPPTFNRLSYTVQVNENVPDGTPLSNLDMFVQDTDTGSNSVFNLQLLDNSNIFSLEPPLASGSSSVSIRISNGPLDYENPNQRKFILLVVAKEAFTNPQLSSTATVTVSIADINDNPPQFPLTEYSATVPETSPPGTVVHTITATDRDTKLFGEAGVIYSLFGNGAERFHVGASSGVITVAQCLSPGTGNCLDYETRQTYYLSYQAVDNLGRGHAAVVPFTIQLSDSNDNAPVFLHDSYSASIDEEALKFDAPLRVQAVDADPTSVLYYSIIAGNEGNWFAIDSRSGEITVSRQEKLSSISKNIIVLTVQARDESKGNVTTTVTINVKDANNNSPIFQKEKYSAVVSESSLPGTVAEQVQASDSDTGLNALVSYRIQKGGFNDFDIDSKIGIVTVGKTSKLDYDRRNEYNLEIIAVDEGIPIRTGTTTVVVSVLNSNDKAPYFSPSTQRAQVNEGEVPGKIFYKLKATDPDVSAPNALSFSIARPSTLIDKDGRLLSRLPQEYEEFFAVDKSTGEVRVTNRLDREQAAVVTMTVIVTDNSASPPQTGTGTLVVTIIELNKQPPTFGRPWQPDRPEMAIHVVEEQPVGSVVSTLVATDTDSNIASYAIEPENSYFDIGNYSGVVSVKQRIDYESVRTIEFRVVVKDTGIPQLTAVALVTANVLNINDNDPVFSMASYQASLAENSPQGTIVTKVSATDADAGDFGKIQYSLIGEKSLDFNVDQQGVVRAGPAATLDREATPMITLQVVATDQGSDRNTRRQTSAPIYISLTDVNDNPPVFSQREYEGTVVYSNTLSPPTSVVQVVAEDRDDGDHTKIIFSLVDGNEKGTFDMNPETGVIFQARELDEKVKDYVLRVRASNRNTNFYDEALVRIRVVDINQERPKFVVPAMPNATVEIFENQRLTSFLVMTVSALDNDRGENGRVSYYLKVGDANLEETDEFQINTVTGELKTKIILDREKTSKYQLVLAARDNGAPKPFESLRFLTVILKDVDDNNPEFPRSQTTNPYVFTLEENMPVNHPIGRVKAEDKDIGNNALIFYYIIDGNFDYHFQLEKTSGLIKSNTSFDREKQSVYEIVVKASSDPDYRVYNRAVEPGFSAAHRTYREEDKSLAYVRIIVSDVNDNPPYFIDAPYLGGVRSSMSSGDLVLLISATDPDEGVNGAFDYQIENIRLFRPGVTGSVRPVPSPFNVSAQGHLVATQLMARYEHTRFVISILAKELAPPHSMARTTVKLWVYEPNQLIKVIIAQPPAEVNKKKKLVTEILSNATNGGVVIDDIRFHVNEKNMLERKWTDLLIHVVNTQDEMMITSQVLEAVDSNSKSLNTHSEQLRVHKIMPVYASLLNEEFDIVLVALISLLVVLFIGIITIAVSCMCLKKWYSMEMADKLVFPVVQDDRDPRNTTENPLWTEQKLKLYEEQELSMNVCPDQHHPTSGRRPRQLQMEVAPSEDDADSAHYATLQRSNPPPCKLETFRQRQLSQDGLNEYATLNGFYSRSHEPTADPETSASFNQQSSLDSENHEYHELQTSTSHPEENSNDGNISKLTLNKEGEPVLITELL